MLQCEFKWKSLCLRRFILSGWVVIRFEVLEETNVIVLHSRNITIIDKWVKEEVEDGHRVEPLNISQLLEYRPFQMVRE